MPEETTTNALYPEPCPQPQEILVPGCQDAVHVQLPAAEMLSLGRIVQVDAVIKNVCPGKRVAVAVILAEVGPDGQEYPRGMKTVTIPAQTGDGCRDVTLKCLPFAVPEGLEPAAAAACICAQRKFHARVIANYLDTDFVCCEPNTVTL